MCVLLTSLLAGCIFLPPSASLPSEESPTTPSETSVGEPQDPQNPPESWTVRQNVQLDGSATFDAMQARGSIVIGVRDDQPGIGFVDAATGEHSGFDIDMALWMAAELGFHEDSVELRTVAPSDRENAIASGDVDLIIGTYSITDARKQLVDFAGPYISTGQGLLVAADDDRINSPEDLDGATVCSAIGSSSFFVIEVEYPEANTVEADTYAECVTQLESGSADAVSADEFLLLGYASTSPEQFRIAGEPFTEERYGIGMPHGDDALRDYLNDALEQGTGIWTGIWDRNFGRIDVERSQPPVDRY